MKHKSSAWAYKQRLRAFSSNEKFHVRNWYFFAYRESTGFPIRSRVTVKVPIIRGLLQRKKKCNLRKRLTSIPQGRCFEGFCFFFQGGGCYQMVFRGNVGEISRRQQSIKSIKEKLQKLDCQLTANEGEGGGHNIVTERLMRNQVNFVFLSLPLR